MTHFTFVKQTKRFGARVCHERQSYASVWKLMRKRLPSGIFINMKQGCDVYKFTEAASVYGEVENT